MTLIWATRGRSWGFRFLRDGGFPDPLPVYDHAFAGTEGESTTYQHIGSQVALRFADPDGRSDEAGRVIPHDIVVLPPLANDIRSIDDGLRIVWPLIADAFESLWDLERPPSASAIRRAFDGDTDSSESDERPLP